jgi:cytochrome b subunit of formate dehydrogenase
MPEQENAVPPAETPAPVKQRYFKRFTPGQRYQHAVLFTTFLGLAATGLPMRFSESIFARQFAAGVGGFGAILFFHKFCALVLTLAFANHVKNIFSAAVLHRQKGVFWGPNSMVATPKDVLDIVGHMRWFVGLGKRPQFDRYSYWEKFDYWAVFWGMIVIGLSGYAMWFAPFFARFLPGWALNAALVIHSDEGLLAILFIFSIHFVNTHLRPGSFPMDMVIFTGVESEEEFAHKRPIEYQRMVSEGKVEERLGEAPGSFQLNVSRVVGYTAIFIGLMLLAMTLSAYFI